MVSVLKRSRRIICKSILPECFIVESKQYGTIHRYSTAQQWQFFKLYNKRSLTCCAVSDVVTNFIVRYFSQHFSVSSASDILKTKVENFMSC